MSEWVVRLESLAAIAERLEPHVSRARYVIEDVEGEKLWVPAEHYSDSDSAAALSEAHEALRLADDFTIWWFSSEE